LIAFKSFYFEREGKELTEEQIQFLQLKPRIIKVHQIEFIATKDRIVSDKEIADTLGFSYEEINEVMMKIKKDK
jgi:hypothetical protein